MCAWDVGLWAWLRGQVACDARGSACGGWSVIEGKAFLKHPYTTANLTGAPPNSLLYTKHCGPWTDPVGSIPTVWPLPAAVSSGNTTTLLTPNFSLTTTAGSALLHRGLQRCSDIVFTHAAAEAGPESRPGTAHPESHPDARGVPLTGLEVVVANESEALFLGVDESYSLTVPAGCRGAHGGGAAAGPCTVMLYAATVFGALRGLETFSQLVRFDYVQEQYFVPKAPVVISDQPRFPYRGIMLDVARHFFPLAALRQTVDAMSYAKFNVLHLHLSDDQSFPVVSRTHPALAAGAFGPTEKYTLGDLTALAQYARDRGVLIVGEFDAPGHSTAWCQGIPALCPSPACMAPMSPHTNLTFEVIADIASEITTAFGSGMYHGGGDEVSYACWESSPAIKAWMSERGFHQPQQAYAYFLQRVATEAAPAAVMFWQDAFERAEPGTPLPADTIIQFYRTGPLAAAAAKHRVVFADNHMWGLDIHTSTKTWDSFYAVDPTAGLNGSLANLIGGESCVWTVTFDASVLSTVLWPRLLAVSEKLWTPKALTANTTANAALERLSWARCMLNSRGVPAASPLANLTPEPSPLYGSCLLQ